jgi:hypothetical protein
LNIASHVEGFEFGIKRGQSKDGVMTGSKLKTKAKPAPETRRLGYRALFQSEADL